MIASLLLNAQLGAFAKTADGRATAVDFITAVTTIVESIAGHGAGNAMAAPASKLVRQTKSLGLADGRFLVGSVLAVFVIVANFRLGDAEEVAAAELAGRTSKMSTHVFGFIRSIAAVVVAIAAPQERCAFAVGAGEIVWRARRVAVELVRPIGTIHVAVTTPIGLDAEFRIGALEFAFAAGRVAISLVTSVIAVELSVAAQRAADAAAVPATEFRLAAVPRCATLLIRSVATIIVVVTAPAPRNTFVVLTLHCTIEM